jgi:F420-dependent oxidoreductase-like protein
MWRAADDIDLYESGWTFDHFYPIEGDSSGPCLEGWTTLTALAQATNRLRLGTLVTGIHYRHPAVLANMASALDIISNGRLELGIGAGWNEDESRAYGIELGTVKERMDRFEEACQVLVGLLSQETTDVDGRFYRLQSARNEPKGPQRPHPPICMGGSGEKRTLRITAKYADHWNFVIGTPEEFARKRDVLASHCADIGRDPKEITLSAHIWLNGERDCRRVMDEAAAFGEEGLDLAIIYLRPPLNATVLEPLAEAIRDSGLRDR